MDEEINEINHHKPIISLQEEFRYNFVFNDELLSKKIDYNKNRYYIFPIDLYDVMKSYWSNTKVNINDVVPCNKRNEIGKILTKSNFKLLIVFYSTSSKFRFYMFTGHQVIRVSKYKIRYLNLFSFGKLIKRNCYYDKKRKEH